MDHRASTSNAFSFLEEVIDLRLSANISTMFAEWPVRERPAAAADAGFAAIEVQFPYGAEYGDLAQKVREAGIQTVLINMPRGRADHGELGLACLPDRRNDFLAAVHEAVAIAHALNCTQIHCLAGNVPIQARRAACWSTLIENMRFAAQIFLENGISALIEPLNPLDHPNYILTSIVDADALIAAVDHANLLLQYDVYHACVRGDDWVSDIAKRRDRIGHIQIADYPGRGQPGTGRTNFHQLANLLGHVKYERWVGCEYFPTGGTIESLNWRATLLSGM